MVGLQLIAVASIAAAAAGFAGGYALRDLSADRELAVQATAHQLQVVAWERASRESSEKQRRIENERREALAKEVEDARTDAAKDARRAVDLGGANQRLLDHVARLAAVADRRSSDPAPAAGSASAAGPGMVLAELYRGANAEAQELATAFDASRRAGLTCERVYDSLSEVQK